MAQESKSKDAVTGAMLIRWPGFPIVVFHRGGEFNEFMIVMVVLVVMIVMVVVGCQLSVVRLWWL